MYKKLLSLFLLYIFSLNVNAQTIRCGTMAADSALRIAHPQMGNLDALEKFIKSELSKPNPKRIIGDVYTIPVVIHIIHNGEAIGTASNISNAQAQSQIDVLNEDFRKKIGTLGYNTHTDGADTKIEFCLAQRKPDGTATTGINRVNRNTAGFTAPPYSNTAYIDATIKPATQWDPSRYFNLWCMNLGGGLLGYAQFPPASGLTGFACDEGLANSDGVVIVYTAFGRVGTVNSPYDLGRTATHEVGHWLGLRHIWGDATCGDDFCNDTPVHRTSNTSCYTHPKSNTCGTPDEMFENYMDYSTDVCLNIFTNDQKTRMRTVLTSSPLRVSLINSDACIPPSTNDAAVVDITNPKQDVCVGILTPTITIKNFGTANLTSATINYKLDGGSLQTQAYSGNLATLATATFNLAAQTIALGNHNLKVYTTLPNAATDANPALDTIVIYFSATAGTAIPYNETFETNVFPPANWLVNNVSNDCFTFREQSGLIGASGTTTTAAFLYHYLYTPGASETDELITNLIDLTSVSTPLDFEFDLAYARKSATQYEDLKIEISTDCGQTYSTIIYNKTGNGSGATDLRTIAANTASDWKPTAANNWRHETIDISAYIGNKIRLKFTTTNRGGNNLYIDNLKMDNTPKVSFATASASYTESSASGTIGCSGYLDVTLTVNISAAPTANAIVTATVIPGTATAADANIISSATFVSGSTTSQNLTFRIYDDEATESIENMNLQLSVTSGPVSVSGSSGTMAITINDNDNYPFLGAATNLFTENFESTTNGSLPTNWTTTFVTAGNNSWTVGTNGGMSGTKSCYITNNNATQTQNYDVTSTSRRRLVSPSINTTGIYNLVLSFDFKCNGELSGATYYDYGRLMYSTNAAGPYTAISGPTDATTSTATLPVFFNVNTATNFTVNLPSACENQTAIYLVWRWDNDNSVGNQPPFTIDNIVLKYYPSIMAVETANSATATKNLPPNSTIYFVSNNNKLLAKIKNTSSFDYGCTTVTINRSGTSAQEYYTTGAGNYLADKTLLITPTNNSATGTLDVTMYYENAEVTGWQTTTSKTFTTTAKVFKSNGSIANITSATPTANGTTNMQTGTTTIVANYGADKQITSSFTTGLKTSAGASFGVGDCNNRIIAGTVSPTVCSSNSTAIPFVALGLFNSSNIFTAQLSNNVGSFTTPTNLTPTITIANNGYYSNTINTTNIPTTSNGTGYRFRVNASNPTLPTMTDNSSNITIQPKGLWLGTTNNFNTASNWCGGLPSSTADAILQTGVAFQPQLTANISCANLTIPMGTSVSLMDYTLSVYGIFTGTGVLTGSSNAGLSILQAGDAGAFYMDNTSSSSKTLNTLSLNRTGSPAGATIGDTINLTGTLTLSNGTLSTNAKLKLLSTSSASARIAAIAGTGVITGNVISQRYEAANKTGWSMLSNAVIGDNILNWQDDFPTSGFPNSTGYAGGFTSVYSYNEAINGTNANGYTAPTNATNTVTNGLGYFAYLGDGFTNSNAINMDATGTVRQGNYNLPVTYTASTTAPLTNDDGWNLVANPYCSNIDWVSGSWLKTNMDNAIYIYDAEIGNYATYVNGAGVNGGTSIIAQNQGFWVKANAASPVLRAAEGIKTTTTTNFFRMAQMQNPQDSIARIKLVNVQNNFQDEAVLRIIDGATTNFDNNFDAYKLLSLNANAVNIYTQLGNANMSINSIPPTSIPIEIPVPIKVAQAGAYDVQFTIPSALSPYMYWKDNVLGTQTPLAATVNINYLFTDTVSPLSRFAIGVSGTVTTSPPSPPALQGGSSVRCYPNPAKDILYVEVGDACHCGLDPQSQIKITDVLGNEIYCNFKPVGLSSAKSPLRVDLEGLSGGVYFVRVNNEVIMFIKE